jgi:hypothetical protein
MEQRFRISYSRLELVDEVTEIRHDISRAVSWSPKTGQVAKRESHPGTAGWPEVRHGKYTEEAQS